MRCRLGMGILLSSDCFTEAKRDAPPHVRFGPTAVGPVDPNIIAGRRGSVEPR